MGKIVSAFILLLALVLVAAGSQLASAAPMADPFPENPEALPANTTVEEVIPNLTDPVAMAFDPSGRLFITQRNGAVRLYSGGTLQASPVITFPVNTTGERGLLGIAIDPDFTENHYIYVYYTEAAPSGEATVNKVVRFTENNGVGSAVAPIYDSPDSFNSTNHNGGNIHFGPDGKLYISVGDDASAANSQSVAVKNGKIHRLNPDGSIPSDNPTFTQTGALPSLYAMGVRNSFDFAFDPVNGTMWASENGPGCDDELNRILPGGNYGWRNDYPCDDETTPSQTYNTIPPIWWLPEDECCQAPTGTEFYSAPNIPEWTDDLFMCDYTGNLRHFHMNGARTNVTAVGILQGVSCQTDIQTGPDGALYYIDGGGYSNGDIMRIVGSGATATPTGSATVAPTNTAVPTNTGTATATATGTPPTATATPCPTDFSDVNPGDFFYDGVVYLFCRDVISGYEDNTFRPYNPTTRGQLSKIVVLAEGWAIDTTGGPHFNDVQTGNPFYQYIETAYNHQVFGQRVISGYDDGSFRPFAPVTRGQLSKIVVVAEGWDLVDPATPSFTDVPANNPFYQFIETARSRGIISGYSDGTFKWGNGATRGQIAKIVYGAVTQP